MALWTPSNLGASLRAFWEGDTLVGADASAVASWVDQTANAYALAQGTGANQPTLQTNELNGHQTVRFDGTDDVMTVASALGSGTQPFEIHGIWKPANAASQVLLHTSNGDGTYLRSGNADLVVVAGTEPATGLDLTLGDWLLTQSVFNGASSSARNYGGTATTMNSGTDGLSGTVHVGRSGTGASFFLNGDIAALLVTATLAAGDRQKLEGWGAWKYGLQANLAGGHPYATAAPTVASRTGLRWPLGTGLRQRTLGS